MELDSRKVLQIIRQNVWIIVLFTMLAAIASFVVTKFFITPEYVSKATLYVQNAETRKEGAGINTADLTAAIKLVQTYTVIMESDLVMDEVARQVGGQYTGAQIRGMFSAESVNETEVLQINVKNESPQMAYNIAAALLRVAPDELMRVIKAGAVEVIDYASYPKHPSSPNMKQNVVRGTLLGFLLSLVILVMLELFKTKISDEQDLAAIFSVATIGVVPEFESQNINAKGKA